jgi:predicted ATPase
MVRAGEAEAGIALMHQSTADRAALGVSWYQPRYLCMLAATYGELGQAEAGLRVIAEAKDRVARHEEPMWEAELERVEGELLRVQGASAAVSGARFEQALAKARRQDAKALELRAAISLARLWRDQGRGEGRKLLTPIYRSFAEGHQTRDLREARVLLQELGEDA